MLPTPLLLLLMPLVVLMNSFEALPALARLPAVGWQMASKVQSRGWSMRVPLPPVRPALDLSSIQGPDDASRPLVVIDAGHGGHDPGTISTAKSIAEKRITLILARALRSQLLASGRVRVALTRDDDRFLVLEERYDIARRMNAGLFISIHADSAPRAEASGVTVYTLSETASDAQAERFARRENDADSINGISLAKTSDDVASILVDLSQRETMDRSAEFARLVLREGEGLINFRPDSRKQAAFVVLKAPDVPSALVEAGYLTNEGDEALLTSASGQRRFAQSLARAVEFYFARQAAE